jgi:hypothetical protein
MLTHHNDTLDCYCSPLWLHHCREARSSVSDRTYCSVVRLLMTVELTFFFSFTKSAPNAAVWGAAAGAAVLLLGSDIPIIKRDILSKVPVFGGYWAVQAPAKEEE